MQRILSAGAIVLFALVLATIAIGYSEQLTLRPLAESYLRLVPQDLGAPNVVTGILLTFRAFDTLGEVAVLFMVAAGVGLVLSGKDAAQTSGQDIDARTPASEIVRNATQILVPLISIFAAYIIMNGHISAGGGFQGGAVIASAVLLLLLANPSRALNTAFLSVTESLAGVLFVLVGIGGLIFAGGFLNNRVLPVGQFGAFFSAGAIPVLSVLLGIKVGCELSVILDRFRS
ncbi:hydrogen gas-evolving membrane-bound hydrogenase subunit E [Pseudorhodoplanes sp.]|uniref:hydrogen gas-evolving membrane-bound hydrogenase subunit E n=1 Tax=Pseudorhodoplanes sp. TaxID=1934341 RepID=UPI002CA0FB5B|nr:hydrogen gas-evolving membrane-bound hydrogenase subunit E [Pseudorhodoplanes sp.]HWL47860.1 hydrogen gas-evolving membrane-bound hydrogenase subunit E [Sphingomonadaceae bacterium]HWV52560.1 hydrogen gas-evolving membrane-bound hydrogenase subunit E [Pseudorhodoplanes sp.]